MFSWLRNLFTTAEPEVVNTPAKKSVTKNGVGFAPKIEPVITEVKKVSAKVKTEKVTKASLSKLTKVKLEEFALATYGVDIDKRKKKADLVNEVLKLSKK